MQKKISIIVPCFNEQEVICQTYEKLIETDFGPYDVEYIFVDDGSSDNTREILRGFAAENKEVKLVLFLRNFGHQAAVSAGMKEATGDAAVIIDADLQDPPEVIIEMLARWEEGYDIAYGKRVKRKGENLFKKITAWGYYRLLGMLGGSYIPHDTGDFRLIDRKVLDFLNALSEQNRFLRGLTAWAGFKSIPVEYVRDPRAAGETKYTLKKMLRLAEDGITAFSDKPLKISFSLGICVAILSVIYLLTSIVLGIMGILPVYHVLCSIITLLLGGVFICIGVMGMYVSRIYDEVKARPMYLVAEKINIGEAL